MTTHSAVNWLSKLIQFFQRHSLDLSRSLARSLVRRWINGAWSDPERKPCSYSFAGVGVGQSMQIWSTCAVHHYTRDHSVPGLAGANWSGDGSRSSFFGGRPPWWNRGPARNPARALLVVIHDSSVTCVSALLWFEQFYSATDRSISACNSKEI